MKARKISTSQRAANLLTKDLAVPFDEEVLHVTVRMTGVKQATIDEMNSVVPQLTELAETTDPDAEIDAQEALRPAAVPFAQLLVDLVVKWDLEDDEGTIPLDVEALTTRLDFMTLMVVATAVGQELKAARDPFGNSGPSKRSTKPKAKPRKK